jgi:dephospho-CoA kinase
MLTVGITGGIGSGKSTVAEYFRRLGVPVIDADLITRELTRPGHPVYQRVIERFGCGIIGNNGQLERRKLRGVVFQNSKARKDLERIIHPEVWTEIFKQLEAFDSAYTLVVVPLMVESDRVNIFDRVIVVDCDEKNQIERVVRRDGCTEDEVKAIIRVQAPHQARLAIATDIIHNTGDVAKLELDVKQLHNQFVGFAMGKE